MKKIGIISQARIGSSRLPGKILKKVLEKSLLEYHLNRLHQTGFPVFVATTVEPQDEQVSQVCEQLGVKCYRGSETDVLSRFLMVIDAEKLDVVVRVTSDCPLIDPALVAEGVRRYLDLNDERVYLSNAIERTYARGFDFEIFSAELLRGAREKDSSQASTEHVTPYLYSHQDLSITLIHQKQEQDHSFLRVTVDEPLDFELVKKLIEEHVAHEKSAAEIEAILIADQSLQQINRNVAQKKI